MKMKTSEQMKQAFLEMEYTILTQNPDLLRSFVEWAHRDMTDDQIESEYEDGVAQGYIEV
jgi:hypothetical protein